MLYIENPSRDACFNQALEEYVFETLLQDDLLLLWRNDPAVICGRYQNLFAEVDILEAARQGVVLVRRITGGGTVYHDPGNLNYALITTKTGSSVDYNLFLDPLRQVLRGLGIETEVILSSALAVNGKKISGSAQRILKNRVLHHGTLLYDSDLNRLRTLANGERQYFTSRGTRSTPWPVTNLRDCLSEDSPGIEVFQKVILAGLGKRYPISPIVLDPAQLAVIGKLAEKYRSWDWTMGTNPPFEFSRQVTLQGNPYLVHYSSKQGHILELTLDPPVSAVSQALAGLPLRPEVLSDALGHCTGFESLAELIL